MASDEDVTDSAEVRSRHPTVYRHLSIAALHPEARLPPCAQPARRGPGLAAGIKTPMATVARLWSLQVCTAIGASGVLHDRHTGRGWSMVPG